MTEGLYQEFSETIKRVLTFIQANLDEPLDVDRLAAVAGYSPFHFQRRFLALVGEPPIEHVRRIRLERAAYQLKSTSESVSSIAVDAGFSSLSAFSRAFEVAFCTSPTQYRSLDIQFTWQTSPTGVHFDPKGLCEFRPLARSGTPSVARIIEVERFHVLCFRHEGHVQSLRSAWDRLVDWHKKHNATVAEGDVVTFTLEPKAPRESWRIKAYVGVRWNKPEVPCDEIESMSIGGGHYLVKSFCGPGWELGDFWARAWHEDVRALGVKPRNGIAYNHIISDADAMPTLPRKVDIYMPVTVKRN